MQNISLYIIGGYAVFFIILGIQLEFTGIRGRLNSNIKPYTISRRVFGFIYLLYAARAVSTEIIHPMADCRATSLFIAVAVSFVNAWLNGYALLLLLDPPAKSKRIFYRYAFLALPIILSIGIVSIIFPGAAIATSYMWGILYFIHIVLVMYFCKRELNVCLRTLHDSGGKSVHLTWLYRVISIALCIALMNLVCFYFQVLELPRHIITMLFYFYFALKLLNFVPTFEIIEKMRTREEENERTAIEVGAKTLDEISCRISPRIENWLLTRQFCKSSISINDVAQALGTNRNYLSIYLNHTLNMSFQQWINTLRVSEGKRLIAQFPEKTIDEISSMVGMPHSYNFSRWFKQIEHVSPLQFRNSL